MSAATRIVHEVLYDLGDGRPGPAADGTAIARFASSKAADAFAAGRTCYGKAPAAVMVVRVPARLALRWGIA